MRGKIFFYYICIYSYFDYNIFHFYKKYLKFKYRKNIFFLSQKK